MNPEQTIEIISASSLIEKVSALRDRGYRLVQICATTLPGQFEITYSFDLATRLNNLRIQVPADDPRIPSIGGIFGCAFLYENEMHDLFGVKVENLAVDLKGNLYNTSVKFAFGSTKTPAAPAKAPAPAPKPAAPASAPAKS